MPGWLSTSELPVRQLSQRADRRAIRSRPTDAVAEAARRNLNHWFAACARIMTECPATTEKLLAESRSAIERSRTMLGRPVRAMPPGTRDGTCAERRQESPGC